MNFFKKVFLKKNLIKESKLIDRKSFAFLKDIYQGRELRIEVEGKSMLPILRPGHVIKVRVLESEKLLSLVKVGDVITFYQPEEKKIISHRVVNKNNKDWYQTKGDNGETKDPFLVYLDDILGLVLL